MTQSTIKFDFILHLLFLLISCPVSINGSFKRIEAANCVINNFSLFQHTVVKVNVGRGVQIFQKTNIKRVKLPSISNLAFVQKFDHLCESKR